MIQGSYYVIMESEDMWICVFLIYVSQVLIIFFGTKIEITINKFPMIGMRRHCLS